MILHRYFASRFALTFSAVFSILALIMFSLDLVEQLRQFASADAGFGNILILSLLNLPKGVYDILPLIMILATLALFLALARSSELVITRAAGRSALKALIAPAMLAFLIGVVTVAALNPIVASTSRQYEQRVDALNGRQSTLSIGRSGLWLRQGDENGQAVIRAIGTNLDGTILINVTFVLFDTMIGPTQRIEADIARLEIGAWRLENAITWDISGTNIKDIGPRFDNQIIIPSTLTANQIRDSFGSPFAISIWDLPAFIERLNIAGFSALRHEMWFHSELAQPAFLLAMVLIGACFTLRHQRGGKTGIMILLAILVSFGVYFLRNFALVMGENGQIPIVLSAWAPPFATIGIALGVLLHNEDG